MACLGATSVSCSCAYNQPREPLGEALPERVAEMRASHQQNLLSQNRARVLGCDFCPPAVCAASFPRASQGWSQLKRPTSRQTSCLNFGYGKCGHSHIGGKSIGFGSCLITAGLRKNKVVAMKLPMPPNHTHAHACTCACVYPAAAHRYTHMHAHMRTHMCSRARNALRPAAPSPGLSPPSHTGSCRSGGCGTQDRALLTPDASHLPHKVTGSLVGRSQSAGAEDHTGECRIEAWGRQLVEQLGCG